MQYACAVDLRAAEGLVILSYFQLMSALLVWWSCNISKILGNIWRFFFFKWKLVSTFSGNRQPYKLLEVESPLQCYTNGVFELLSGLSKTVT